MEETFILDERRTPLSRRAVFGLTLAGLLIACTETVIAVLERWPAQLGGAGDPAKIATQWMTKGTALSPPLFILIGMALAVALLGFGRRRLVARLGAVLAVLTGGIGVYGTLGELLATPGPDIPTTVHYASLIGLAFSAAWAVAGVIFVWRPGPEPDV
jgi:hypothetical protein